MSHLFKTEPIRLLHWDHYKTSKTPPLPEVIKVVWDSSANTAQNTLSNDQCLTKQYNKPHEELQALINSV